MNPNAGVAIMGGTFDPIHNGHLRTAVELLDKHHFTELRLIPCYQPVHKSRPNITPEQRLNMVKIASQIDPRLRVDEREIIREDKSYTIDTLKDIRAEIGNETPLVMVLGMDSFISLPTWRDWSQLINYAHILIVARPSWDSDFVSELSSYYEVNRACSASELQSQPCGKIYMETLTPLSISSSMIRTLCQNGKSIAFLLPESVQSYIEQNKLYI